MKSFPVSNGSWNFHALFSCHSCLNLAGKHCHGLTFWWKSKTCQNVKENALQLSKAKVNVPFLHGKSCLKKLWQTKKVKTSSTKVCPHPSTIIDLRIFHAFLQMCLTLLRITPFKNSTPTVTDPFLHYTNTYKFITSSCFSSTAFFHCDFQRWVEPCIRHKLLISDCHLERTHWIPQIQMSIWACSIRNPMGVASILNNALTSTDFACSFNLHVDVNV